MKKLRDLLAILIVGLLYSQCATAQNKTALHLAQNGKTTYVIALADDAIPAEKTAAEQLQKYLQRVTGAMFPIQTETQVQAAVPQILVGAGTRAKKLLASQAGSTPKLGSDGILIKTVGDDLVLAGDRPRGTLYAVFQFLEDEVGCRWWTPTENVIPSKSTLNVPPQNVVYTSPFSYREHFTTAVREDPIFATIMRENGHFQKQSEEWGGHYDILGFVHTFSQLIPLEKYFKEHPEWYSDPMNGYLPCTKNSKMPDRENTDPDLSNPQVLEEVTKNALEWIAKNPDAGYISISQNDNNVSYCHCAECAAFTEAEGSPSGPLLHFVNQVAGRIHEKYPNFLVETLAYHYSEKPPKTVRPAKNVIIRLAPIASDFGHPLNSDWNEDTRERLLAWSQISPQLFMWNYVTNFGGNMLPHPNWDGLAKDLRFFADNKVIGVFEQGDAYTNGVGDFVQLRAWLMAKLMWNPNLDQDKLMNEFLAGYYGAGAPYLRQYIDLLQKSYLAQNRRLPTSNTDFSFFTLDVMNQSMQLFDKASQAVQNDKVISERIRRERLSLELVRLYRFKKLHQIALDEDKPFLDDSDPQHAMQQLIDSAKHFGIQYFTEGGSFEAKIPALLSMFAPLAELPEFAKQVAPRDVIDLQSSEFSLYLKGNLTELEQDDNASGNSAASMIGDTSEWAIQANLAQYLDSSGKDKWHIYALVRAEFKEGAKPEGIAFQSGVYDEANRVGVGSKQIPVDQVQQEKYQRIDLGASPLTGGMFIWFAPVRNAAIVKIYVDRIILIREK